jgi:hypothetical protein
MVFEKRRPVKARPRSGRCYCETLSPGFRR